MQWTINGVPFGTGHVTGIHFGKPPVKIEAPTQLEQGEDGVWRKPGRKPPECTTLIVRPKDAALQTL